MPAVPELRRDMLGFDQSLHQADRNVARILDALDASEQAANTIVVFTTDHGLPLPRAKCDLRDPGLEAALLVRWPGRIGADRVCSELYDLAHDPLELRPRVATTPDALPPEGQALHATLRAWMERTADPLLQGPVECPNPMEPPDVKSP